MAVADNREWDAMAAVVATMNMANTTQTLAIIKLRGDGVSITNG